MASEIDGDRLSRNDILDICFLFLIAGLDTVSDSLTCFYAFLATHPEHRRQIVDHPDVIAPAVEELLRWESPVPTGVPRVATQDTEMPNGVHIPEGTAVAINYGAANVCPATFGDPFEVRFDREVNPHIAFGGGVHRCSGRTSPAVNFASRCGSGTAGSPSTGSSPDTRSSCTRPVSAT